MRKMKKLNERLYELFKQEDLKSCNKAICSLRLDGEEVSNKRRVFSKIFKLDENTQNGFTMKKPLPIGTFKKKAHVNMDISFNSIENFDPNAKASEIFVVDIEFNAYNDSSPKKFITRFFPVFLSPRARYWWTDVASISCSPP